jgi:hypothetical protein
MAVTHCEPLLKVRFSGLEKSIPVTKTLPIMGGCLSSAFPIEARA